MKFGTLTVAILTSALPVSSLGAGVLKFEIDPAHTSITFKVRHMMVSTVVGTFHRFGGRIEMDTSDITKSRAYGWVDVASIDTRNSRRDDHLRSPDFFNVKKYPRMSMAVKRIYKKGEEWWADADLTIKGTTRRVSFPFKWYGPVKDPWGNLRIGIEARFKIDRYDFGITWNKTMETGGLVVGREVEVELNVEAIHKP